MDQDVQPADMRIETDDQLIESTEDAPTSDDGKVSAVEAFAHAIAMNAHQHAGVVEEDAPATAVRLPFPRPAFDQDKHMALMFDQLARIDALKIEALKADDHAKRASELKKDAHQAVADAHEELDRQVRILRDEHAAAGDEPEPVQLPLTASGRTPCAWERDHPGMVCAVCTAERHAPNHTTSPNADALPTCTSTHKLASGDPKGVAFLECWKQQGHDGSHECIWSDTETVMWADQPSDEPKAETFLVFTTIDGCRHFLTEQQATGELFFQPERSAATGFADHETSLMFATPFASEHVIEIRSAALVDEAQHEESRVLPMRNRKRSKKA